jgi:hypothetical protein
MEAKNTADVPSIIVRKSEDPEDNSAPTKVIPDMALAPDMRGVCNVEGTFVINSTPKKIESTRMNINSII